MNARKRQELQRALQRLAHSYRSTLELMERTFTMLREESAAEPLDFWGQEIPSERARMRGTPEIDAATFTIRHRGRICYLGNTLAFKLLRLLAQRPNIYISHAELLQLVWDGLRSQSAVKSVVLDLRRKLRRQGLDDLAAAVDGSNRGHYVLRLPIH